jgi:hypothetical protein
MRDHEVLKALLPAISKIDSGCETCIERFVEKANEALKHAAIGFHYKVLGEETEEGYPKVVILGGWE